MAETAVPMIWALLSSRSAPSVSCALERCRLLIIRMSFHEIVCLSFSTLDPKLDPFESRPPECALREATAA